jgi:hypothetical protein
LLGSVVVALYLHYTSGICVSAVWPLGLMHIDKQAEWEIALQEFCLYIPVFDSQIIYCRHSQRSPHCIFVCNWGEQVVGIVMYARSLLRAIQIDPCIALCNASVRVRFVLNSAMDSGKGDGGGKRPAKSAQKLTNGKNKKGTTDDKRTKKAKADPQPPGGGGEISSSSHGK